MNFPSRKALATLLGTNRFTLRLVSFEDLSRSSAYFLHVTDKDKEAFAYKIVPRSATYKWKMLILD
jgi:hypothetical protein